MEQPNNGHTFFSRRNAVCLLYHKGTPFIRKTFEDPCVQRTEVQCYHLLRQKEITVPSLLLQTENTIYLSYIPGRTALEILEEAEQSRSFDPTQWKQLVRWCCAFYAQSKLCLVDPNLRNFIYSPVQKDWYGIDFESCHPGDFRKDFAKLIAYLLLYDPRESETKGEIAQLLTASFCASTSISIEQFQGFVQAEKETLLLRRAQKGLPK